MVKFRCMKCGFEIEPYNKDRTKPFTRCPYCGTEGSMSIKKHILEELRDYGFRDMPDESD
jgi:predicted Zn-ribbon and HTH transcriptional regulator